MGGKRERGRCGSVGGKRERGRCGSVGRKRERGRCGGVGGEEGERAVWKCGWEERVGKRREGGVGV